MEAKYDILGTLSRLRGYNGDYLLISNKIFSDDRIENLEQVFLLIDGLLVPFFIEYIEILTDTSMLIKFDDINSDKAASKFLGVQVMYVPFEGMEEVEEGLNYLIGYSVIDKHYGNIGVINEILDYGENILFVIRDNNNKEVLFPVHEDLIDAIDETSKTLKVTAPDGLLSL